MESEERKERFVALLRELLKECDGIKGKLAQRLGIKPSRLTGWLQGTIDPAGLEVLVFERIAQVILLSTDELVQRLGIVEVETEDKRTLDRLKSLVEEMLTGQSQEQLGKRLRVSQKTISTWINPERNIDPGKIPIATIALLAKERGWTIERLLAYLGLKKNRESEEDLLAKIESQTLQLSFPSLVKLQLWFSREIENRLKNLNIQVQSTKVPKIFSDKKVCIVLENEDFSRAGNYLSNLLAYARLKPENISIATATKIPEPLSDFDVLVVDVASDESPCLSLIERIEFDGALVVFADSGLSEAIRDRLSAQVTGLLIKPIPWSELKDLPYFS